MQNGRYPSPHTIQRHVLANGITVLIYENFATESILIEGTVRAGALAERNAQAGLADFTALMLLRGTTEHDFEAIYEAMESVGANLGFGGGRHLTDFSAVGLTEDIDLLLALLAGSLRQPTFPAAQVEKVRGQLLTGLQMRANNTRRMAGLKFHEVLYQGHPYGRSTQGYPETIKGIQQDDLVQFHQSYYGPQQMIITVVGGVKAAEALAKITAVFSDWQPTTQQLLPAAPDVAPPQQLIQEWVHMPDKSQSDIYLGAPGPRRSAPDYLDASLMNTVLGVFGMMGRIGKSVREEQGLAYYAYSHLQGGLGPVPWFVSAGVSPDKVSQAVATIRDEIRRMQDELVPVEELADSQAYRIGSMPVGLETNSGLASVIGDMELFGLGLDYLQRYPDLMKMVTPQRIQAAAQKYLSADEIAIVVAGPELSE